MRVGVISDIHGNSVALHSVINDMSKQKINNVIVLGDLIMKGPDPQGVMRLLEGLNVICSVKGNTDKWLEEITDDWLPANNRELMIYDIYNYTRDNINQVDINYIKELPEQKRVTVGKRNILCVHGSPRSISEEIRPEYSDDKLQTILDGIEDSIILSGHIHHQFIRKVNSQTIINPGAVGLRNNDNDSRAAYIVLDINDNDLDVQFNNINYDHDEIIKLGEDKQFPHLDIYKNLLKVH